MTSKLLLLVLLASCIFCDKVTLQSCNAHIEQYRVYPSTGEVVEWDLKDDFFDGSYLTYSLSPAQTLFEIQKPFAQLSSPQRHYETINRVTAFRALQEKSQRVWLNHFVFIEQELDTVDLFYATAAQGDNSIPPSFSKKISIVTGNTEFSCLGVEYVTQDKFLLDCLDSTSLPFQNKFLLVEKNGNVKLFSNSNYNNYSVNSKRITQFVTITNSIGHSHQYLFRSTPAFATEYAGLDQSSLLEVFYVDSEGQPRLQSVLDAATLAVLIDVQDPQHLIFSLIDFKVFSNGRVYILTAKDGVVILQLLGNGEFQFIERVKTSSDQAYEFDIDFLLQSDGSTKEVIALMFSDYIQIIEDKTSVNNYVLDFTSSYPATIAISQQFLVIQNKGITYLFSTEHEELISKETLEGAKATFINPFETEIITITSIDARRYSLTHGLLRFPNTSTAVSSTQSFKLIATDYYSNQCETTIVFKVYNQTDYAIYATNELSLPEIFYDTPSPLFITELASGPNQNYVQLLSQNIGDSAIIAKVAQLSEMLMESISLPSPSNIIYSDILILDNSLYEKYALLLQTSDKYVTIYTCFIKTLYSARSECLQYEKFLVADKLTLNNFVWWNLGEYIYHLTVENNYNGVIRRSSQNYTSIVDTISYENDSLNKITSVTLLKDKYYFVLGNRKQIDIWNDTKEKIYSITEGTLQNLGYAGNWNPQRVYGNRVHNTYLFFIANEDNVVIADFHQEFTIIKVLTYSKGTIEVAVGLEAFFVAIKTTSYSELFEYDLQNLNSIQLLKSLPLYWYTLQSPLQTDFSSDTGTLFVRAYDSKSAQTVILIYSPYELLRDSLVKVVPLGTKVNDGTSLVFSAAGNSQMIFYANAGNLQKVYSFYQSPVLTLKPNYDNLQQLTVTTLKFQVSNYADVSTVTFSQVISLINTLITLEVEQNILDSKNITAKAGENYLDLDNDWFSGSAIELDIDCQQCTEGILPIQTVHQADSGSFNGYHFVDAVPFRGSRTLYLANKDSRRVLIADGNNSLESSYSISLGTTTSDQCEFLAPTTDNAYIFAICSVNGAYAIHVAKCTTVGTPDCHAFGEIQPIDGVYKVSQAQVYGNYLFVLNSNPNRPKNFEGSLVVYKWTAGTQQITFELQQSFNKASFGNRSSYYSKFYLTTYQPTTVNYIKILLLDSQRYLYSFDGTVSSTGVITWETTYQYVDLYQYLNSINYFASSTTQYYSLLQLQVPDYSSSAKTLTTYTLITTDNSGHYALKLVFNVADITKVSVTTRSIQYVLTQYTRWTGLNKATVGNGYAIVAYTNNAQVLLASYKLPSLNNGQVVRIIGGALASYGYPQVNEFVAYIPQNIELPRLYANILRNTTINENLLITYQLNPTYQLYVFNQQQHIYPQYVLLTVKNTVYSETGYFFLQTTDSEEPIREKSFLDKMTSYLW